MNTPITISIKRKNVYGNENIYVCESIYAQQISQLTGKRTVSLKDLEALKALGVTVRDIDQEIKQLMNQ